MSFEVSPPALISLYDHIDRNVSKIAGYVYNDIIESVNVLPQLATKLRKYMIVDMERLARAFKNIKKLTNITKYRDFQYRLLSSDIHFNNRLYHWRIKDSNVCELLPS